jgi:hypothetical protein
MKALSLWQPWATLVIIGAKQWETRPRNMLYRGPLAIHAAKFMHPEFEPMCASWPFKEIFDARGFSYATLPRGVILGTTRVVDCRPTIDVAHEIELIERAFGDYRPGRFAIELADTVAFTYPIPARGMQGLWDWTQDADGQGALFE